MPRYGFENGLSAQRLISAAAADAITPAAVGCKSWLDGAE